MKYQEEVKKILKGYNARANGFYVAAEGIARINFFGDYNGSDTLRLRGLYCLQRQYLIPGKLRPALEKCVQQLYRIGSPALLRENREAVCCLRMRAMGNPVFMVLENKAKVLVLYVYTARTLFAKKICNSMVKLYEEGLTEWITPSGEPTEVKKSGKAEKREEKKLQTQQKKETKEKKKEEKLSRREKKEELRMVREIKREQLREELRTQRTPQSVTQVPIIEGMDGDDADVDIEEYMEHYIKENH